MKRTIFSLSFMALFLILFVVGCQKVGDQPNPKTETAKTPRGEKSGQPTLLEQLVANNDFRQIYEGHREFDSLKFAKVHSLDAQTGTAFIALLQSFNENTPVETIVNAFDITTAKYEAIISRINNGHINLRSSLPAVGSLTSIAYADLLGGGYKELDDVYPPYGYGDKCKEKYDKCLSDAKTTYDAAVNRILASTLTNSQKATELIKAGDERANEAAGCSLIYAICAW